MKRALVTGSTKGIGKAIAWQLLAQGCFVYMCYASDDATAAETSCEFEEKYPNLFEITKVDLSDYDASMKYCRHILSSSPEGIDYLIFNAGGTLKKPLGEITYPEWKRCFDINLNIPFFMIQEFSSAIRENGRIIFISSVMSTYEHSGSIAYGVSKASINSLTEYLVKYFCDRAITVNAVITGFTNTKMIARVPEHEERIKSKIALHRFAEPEEIARFVCHIIEDGYVNGSLMEIDGGYCFQ